MIDDEGNEGINESSLGTCGEVFQEFISDKELVYFHGTKNSRTSSIILRGPNDYTLDEMERFLLSFSSSLSLIFINLFIFFLNSFLYFFFYFFPVMII